MVRANNFCRFETNSHKKNSIDWDCWLDNFNKRWWRLWFRKEQKEPNEGTRSVILCGIYTNNNIIIAFNSNTNAIVVIIITVVIIRV